MRLIYILYLLLAQQAIAFAQDQPVELWQAVEYVKNINIQGPVIETDRFLNTYMLTNQTDESPFGGFTLVKYDTLGNALWKRHSPIGIIGVLYGSFTVDSAGNAYVGQLYDGTLPGYDADAVLIKYSPEGDILWEANYGLGQAGDSYLHYSGMDTLHGRLITLGMNLHDTIPDENFLFVQAVDTSDGSVAWRTKIPGIFRPQNLRIQVGHIQLLSTSFKPDGIYFVNTLVDFDGNIMAQYEKPYSGYLIDFNYISKTGDVIFGNRALGYAVTRVNIEGDTLWRYEYPSGYIKNWVRSIVEDDSLNVYATGSTQTDNENSSFTTVKIKDGIVLWEDFYQIEADNFNTGEYLSINGELLVVIGGGEIAIDSSKTIIKVYKKDSGEESHQITIGYKNENGGYYVIIHLNDIFFTGYSHEGIANTVNIVSGRFRLPKMITNIIYPLNKGNFNLYPNPAADNIHISNIDLAVFDQIILYTMNSEIVTQKAIEKEAEELSLHGLPSGSYIISLQGKGVNVSKKIIKI